jgi:carboxypeptidase Taq
MSHDLDLDHVMSSQNLIPIRDWFAKHVYAYGKLYPPFELLKKVTHDHLNPEPYCVYLENKFKAIYNIK